MVFFPWYIVAANYRKRVIVNRNCGLPSRIPIYSVIAPTFAVKKQVPGLVPGVIIPVTVAISGTSVLRWRVRRTAVGLAPGALTAIALTAIALTAIALTPVALTAVALTARRPDRRSPSLVPPSL